MGVVVFVLLTFDKGSDNANPNVTPGSVRNLRIQLLEHCLVIGVVVSVLLTFYNGYNIHIAHTVSGTQHEKRTASAILFICLETSLQNRLKCAPTS